MEVDYNFYTPGYTYAFQDDQVLLEKNDKELKQVCPYCLIVPRYPLFLNADTSHVFNVSKNIGNINLCLKKFVPCPICQQSLRLDEFYTYKVEKN